MDLPLPPDFREFLLLLNSAKVEYLLVGGSAVGYHGYPRPTGDLDVWVAVHPQTASKLVHVLRQFGFGDAGATEEDFLTPNRVIRMGVPPVRIEVLNAVSGVEFESAYGRRLDVEIDGVPTHLISREDLLANERAAGREKDKNDLKPLEL